MSKLHFIFLILPKITLALRDCGMENVTIEQFCSLDKDYLVGKSGQNPMDLISSVTVFSVFNLDEKAMSISLIIHLAMVWNDTRLWLESNNKVK